MEKEDQIISMLEKIMGTLDEHSQILAEHSKQHASHTATLKEHSQILIDHSRQHENHTLTLENHTSTINEHGQLLSALRTGQEHLKAEVEGMKISNAKEFGSLKQHRDEFTVQLEILRDESWKNK